MSRTALVKDQRGTTLVELTVAMAAGSVVLFALTMMIVVTLHSSTRVSAAVSRRAIGISRAPGPN